MRVFLLETLKILFRNDCKAIRVVLESGCHPRAQDASGAELRVRASGVAWAVQGALEGFLENSAKLQYFAGHGIAQCEVKPDLTGGRTFY